MLACPREYWSWSEIVVLEFETLSKLEWYTHVLLSTYKYQCTSFLGIIFLFFCWSSILCCSQPKQAIKYYRQAMSAQSQYHNLCHVSNLEMAIGSANHASLSMGYKIEFELLEKEATVSEFIAAWHVTYSFFFFLFFMWSKWLFVYGRVELRRIPMM